MLEWVLSASRQTRILDVAARAVLIAVAVLVTAVSHAQIEDGPPAQANKKIMFLASNLRNGGVKAVNDSFAQAAKQLKWKVEVVDCVGNRSLAAKELKKLKDKSFDGIVIGGFDGADFRSELKKLRKLGVKTVGWHAASKSGATPDLFFNVTTDPIDVANTATKQLTSFGAKSGGVIILTDRDFAVATAKTLAMKKNIEGMADFKLLEVEDLSIAKSDSEIAHLVKAWNQKFGKTWTHTIAINDIYFDNMASSLKDVKRDDVVGIAAGDGSEEAVDRIRTLKATQLVTIAEPLKMQGWQLADELNRAFAGEAPSYFQSELIVVSKKYLDSLKGSDIEERLDYQNTYMNIWYPKKH
ncbi:substrate-binding domain-containing protein [Bdellovibrio sp. HCB209]|uniref:substrate-binding domain-containing protein n=1 Tax=Bdellovibrio sp. HCB209 TaxID=3394354 RepID=UPI0039B414E6